MPSGPARVLPPAFVPADGWVLGTSPRKTKERLRPVLAAAPRRRHVPTQKQKGSGNTSPAGPLGQGEAGHANKLPAREATAH